MQTYLSSEETLFVLQTFGKITHINVAGKEQYVSDS